MPDTTFVSTAFTRVMLGALLALLFVPARRAGPTRSSPTSERPGGDALSDRPIEVGMKIRSSQDGYITALRFYKQPNNTGTHIGHLWTAGGQQLAEAAFENETASGWQEQPLPTPVPDHGGHDLRGLVLLAAGQVRLQPAATSPARSAAARCTAPADGNGVYKYGAESAFPNETWNATNYWVDANFSATPPGDTRAPQVTAVTPADGATDVPAPRRRRPPRSTSRWTPATITAQTFTLKDDLNNSGAGDRRLRRADAQGDADAVGAARARPHLHRHGRRRRRRQGRGRQPARRRPGRGASARPPRCPCTVFAPTEGPFGDAHLRLARSRSA